MTKDPAGEYFFDPEKVNSAAEGMLRNFGLDAVNQAQQMAGRLASRFDRVGEAMWLAIGKRIVAIRSKPREP